MALLVRDGVIHIGDIALDPLDCEKTLLSLSAINGLWEVSVYSEYYGCQDVIAEIYILSSLYNPNIEEVYLCDLLVDSGMVSISSGSEKNTIDVSIDGLYPVYGSLDECGRLMSIRIQLVS